MAGKKRVRFEVLFSIVLGDSSRKIAVVERHGKEVYGVSIVHVDSDIEGKDEAAIAFAQNPHLPFRGMRLVASI